MNLQTQFDQPLQLLQASDRGNASIFFTPATFCPPGLQLTGDGSDNGNLGRMYLKVSINQISLTPSPLYL
jgi:hypothetical protein